MHTHGAGEAVGGATALYGIAIAKNKQGYTLFSRLKGGDVEGAAYQAAQSVPGLGKLIYHETDPAMATNRAMFGGGLVLWGASRVIKHFFPSLHRVKIKVDRKIAIAPV